MDVELAEFLARRGRRVTVVEEGPVLALEMAHPRRWRVLHELREAGVQLETNARVREIASDHVRIERGGDAGSEPSVQRVPADSVILARDLAPNPLPVARLREAGVPVHVVGDADGVAYLEGAIRDAFRVAIEL
jgi:NADH dehydrogenase FAD-containing subunit